ncbi:MAG: M20/M25/M40 family metallo-hydrolase [Treponema sp.]|nr:M20/M25/M40 family metallo-hydrolase [Treponema sp.]
MNFIEKFQEAIKIPTWRQKDVNDEDETALEPLVRFQGFLKDNFSAFHNSAQRWVLNPYSVIYHLPGKSKKGAVLFLSHYDVVPAEKEKWNFDPFGAEINEGFIYGRGTIDMKSTLVCIMEAAENLCAQGWKPEKDIWFAFGGDEERGGALGAKEAANWFKERKQKFDWIMDEGSPIAENQIEGIDTPLALISIEEKGNLSLYLTVEQQPGHASRPPKIQAAAILGKALIKIGNKSFPYKLRPTVEVFFKEISKMIPGIKGFVLSHTRLLGPLFFKLVATSATVQSMLKTTVAMTMLEGSAADNVMPSKVRAVINMRLLPPWTIESATAYIKKIINDKRVQISMYEHGANPVTANYTANKFRRHGWQEIENALNEVYPGIPLLPFIMVAITDSRHYKELTDSIIRFNPQKLTPEELDRVHGHDERISIENLNRELLFYTNLLRVL